jgi:hypothetical protein
VLEVLSFEPQSNMNTVIRNKTMFSNNVESLVVAQLCSVRDIFIGFLEYKNKKKKKNDIFFLEKFKRDDYLLFSFQKKIFFFFFSRFLCWEEFF